MFPKTRLAQADMATLQYALKRGIEREFQLEEAELMAELLPDPERRNAILFYEAAEGGAGVLTGSPWTRQHSAALPHGLWKRCHYQRKGDAWRFDQLIDTDDDCEAGCYRCLLSYYNQPEHDFIDRRSESIRQILCRPDRSRAPHGNGGTIARGAFR